MLFGVACATALPSDGRPPEAAPEGRRVIDAARPGWRVAPLTPRVAARFVPSTMSPSQNVLAGDFDGNCERDLALLADYPTGGGGRRAQLFVLLRTRGVFRAVALGDALEAGPNRNVWPRARGEELWDLDLERPFVCGTDAISLHYDCCGCRTFIFRAGRFQSIRTCD